MHREIVKNNAVEIKVTYIQRGEKYVRPANRFRNVFSDFTW